jgi:GAF domain-containing protein
LLYARLPRLNWAGFYLWRGGQLVLGPFQGKPACMRIERGRGVCGAAAVRRTSIIVPDVHRLPGHITCDTASASEIVVPMELPDRQLGLLDLDSPNLGRFDEPDRAGLETVVGILVRATDWPENIGDPAKPKRVHAAVEIIGPHRAMSPRPNPAIFAQEHWHPDRARHCSLRSRCPWRHTF